MKLQKEDLQRQTNDEGQVGDVRQVGDPEKIEETPKAGDAAQIKKAQQVHDTGRAEEAGQVEEVGQIEEVCQVEKVDQIQKPQLSDKKYLRLNIAHNFDYKFNPLPKISDTLSPFNPKNLTRTSQKNNSFNPPPENFVKPSYKNLKSLSESKANNRKKIYHSPHFPTEDGFRLKGEKKVNFDDETYKKVIANQSKVNINRRKLFPNHIDYAHNLIEKKIRISMPEIKEEIKKKFSFDISASNISRNITKFLFQFELNNGDQAGNELEVKCREDMFLEQYMFETKNIEKKNIFFVTENSFYIRTRIPKLFIAEDFTSVRDICTYNIYCGCVFSSNHIITYDIQKYCENIENVVPMIALLIKKLNENRLKNCVIIIYDPSNDKEDYIKNVMNTHSHKIIFAPKSYKLPDIYYLQYMITRIREMEIDNDDSLIQTIKNFNSLDITYSCKEFYKSFFDNVQHDYSEIKTNPNNSVFINH